MQNCWPHELVSNQLHRQVIVIIACQVRLTVCLPTYPTLRLASSSWQPLAQHLRTKYQLFLSTRGINVASLGFRTNKLSMAEPVFYMNLSRNCRTPNVGISVIAVPMYHDKPFAPKPRSYRPAVAFWVLGVIVQCRRLLLYHALICNLLCRQL